MADISQIKDLSGTSYTIKDSTARSSLANKQDTLVSGTNIKTINGTSLLGSGNIVVGGGNVSHNTDAEAGSPVTLNADQIQGYDLNALIDLFYPVGSIYSSTVSTSPAVLFGRGTWVAIEGRFLIGANSTYTAGTTGGEATHTLTTEEMPNHEHLLVTELGASGITQDFERDAIPTIDWTTHWRESYTGLSQGGSQPHNNMPPYLAVYMWKRTA